VVSVAEEQVAEEHGVAASTGADPTQPTHPGRSWRADLTMALVCLAGALYLTGGMWLDPYHRVIKHNQGDQALFEWLLTYQAHALGHLHDPLWTTLLNAPVGVNLAVNTSMVVVGTVVAPVTLLLGAPVAYLVVLTLNLALVPYAWYHVLSARLTRTRAAAVLGGLFCGFAPGVISHANGHLNFTGQFLVPFIVALVLRLATPAGRTRRDGLLLGLLVVVEFSIGAEMLFFVAFGCAVLLGVWGLLDRPRAREALPGLLRGLGWTAGVAAVALAYPLWLQFAGPGRYHGIGFDQRVHSEDLASYAAYPYLSVARLLGLWTKLAPNFTEETTFLGPPLLLLVILSAVALRRRVEVRALAATGLVFAVLALGPRLRAGGHATPVPLPYALLWRLPVFNAALPARLDLILIPIAGVLLALAADQVLAHGAPRTGWWRSRRAWLAGFAVALLPILPLPVPSAHRDAVPHFFTDGTWRQYVHSGQTLVPVPPASDLMPDGQRWQTATRLGFAIPAGFFLGPGPDRRSQIGPIPRPTAALLTAVALHGKLPVITDVQRRQAREDLAYWHATVIVLSDGGAGSRWTANRPKLLQTATALFGQPQRVDDVWLWRVPPG
jgi:hypothetical protein